MKQVIGFCVFMSNGVDIIFSLAIPLSSPRYLSFSYLSLFITSTFTFSHLSTSYTVSLLYPSLSFTMSLFLTFLHHFLYSFTSSLFSFPTIFPLSYLSFSTSLTPQAPTPTLFFTHPSLSLSLHHLLFFVHFVTLFLPHPLSPSYLSSSSSLSFHSSLFPLSPPVLHPTRSFNHLYSPSFFLFLSASVSFILFPFSPNISSSLFFQLSPLSIHRQQNQVITAIDYWDLAETLSSDISASFTRSLPYLSFFFILPFPSLFFSSVIHPLPFPTTIHFSLPRLHPPSPLYAQIQQNQVVTVIDYWNPRILIEIKFS